VPKDWKNFAQRRDFSRKPLPEISSPAPVVWTPHKPPKQACANPIAVGQGISTWIEYAARPVVGWEAPALHSRRRAKRHQGLREILGLSPGRPERVKISLLAASHETFRNRFQLLPPRANLFRFGAGDSVVGRRGGDDGEQVGKFLNDLVGGWNEEMRMRRVLRVRNEKPAGALADPLDEALVAGALD